MRISEVRVVEHHGIRLATEAFGDPNDPPVLLVMGATASMLGWPDEFCISLAERGLHVIRYDHRDTGQSTTVPPGEATYAVEDLAEDAIAILNGYGIDKAHLIGMSLGGFIAQMLAVAHPERVASLTLIASEPLGWDGAELPHISQAFLDHFGTLASLDWSDRGAVADFLVESGRLCAGSGTPFDEFRERARVERIMSRTDSLPSMFNHGALFTRDDWTGRFREISCPVLVIHGAEDPILPVENGTAIAHAIPNTSLTVLAGTGHEIPVLAIQEIVEQISAHVRGSCC
ncbi:TPA: alpha/beta hydrolase [Escherichia coli]|nr:alpha/beta fold hydrolase [Escherichia coli]EAX7557565.1 alpha/beta hydrolase [Salmonella enterica]EAY2582340.1 alpha/beta hydrolase [Salmonella enterica subsp. enterica serovar Typhimurium]EBS5642448.1 alpha/beta fold hydrolase [Salmonella enterica subsp. enterica serovar Saintpaul]EBZ0090635.1 alpha/beta hydrolase [Salmonella enterica subsp. enterica serovar Heidelberg]ECZ3603433.1 alpha/beta hydrolase [Salmonella enterica subsp. enterica serovar Derby]EGL1367741.1 alpha/beta hydrolase [